MVMKEGPETSGGSEGDREKISPEELVFHYSRARRLERASEAVRQLNEPGPDKRGGLFKASAAAPGGIMVLISIALVFVFILAISSSPGGRKGPDLGGNTLAVSALRFSGSTYVVVKKTARNERAYTGPVDLAVSVFRPEGGEDAGELPPITTERLFFTLEPEEEFRIALPLEAPELVILARAGEELITLRVKTE
jgi:hypothetical protein